MHLRFHPSMQMRLDIPVFMLTVKFLPLCGLSSTIGVIKHYDLLLKVMKDIFLLLNQSLTSVFTSKQVRVYSYASTSVSLY